MKKNSTILNLAKKRREQEWEKEESPSMQRVSEQKSEVQEAPQTEAKPFAWLNEQEDSKSFFNDWRKQISDNRKEAEYRYSLSDEDRDLYDTIKKGEGYSSEYLKDRSGGDYTKKLDLKYENDEWNNLSRDQKERYLRLANASTDTDIYEKLMNDDKRLYDRINEYEHDDNGRTFLSNDDDERNYRMYREAQKILIGGDYSDEFKQHEQKKMFFSLPDDIREGLIVFSDKGGLFQTSTESPMKDEIIDTLRNKYNYSDDEIDMLFKYGAAVYNAEQQQEYNELIEHELSTNPAYAVIAPFQQAGADIASGLAAPRTLLNRWMNKGSYGVADPYQTYMQNVGNTGEYIGNSIRSTLEERGDALGWLASKSYGVNMSLMESAMRGSIARSFAGAFTSANPMASYESMSALAMNAMMGSAVVQQTITELTNKGVSTDQAVSTALVRGFFECLFETVSLEKIGMFSQTPILKTATKQEFFKNLAKAGFTEGMEEVSTDLANDIYDMLMNYDYSDFESFAAEHPDWDADTLRSEYIIKKIGDYAGSFLGGAISGLGLGTITGGMAYNNVSNWANQGVSVNDNDYARMATVVESVARQNPQVAETLREMDEEGVDDVIRRGYFKTVVDSIEKNYSQAIDKAENVKQLDNVMENLNRQTNSVISQDIINKYNAKLVEFGKEGKVDYDTFIQNRDSNANTTFSELAFGNGESAIARNIRSDIETVTEGFNAVVQDSLLQKEALRKAAEAQTRLEENNERVSTIIRNFAALGKDMDSPEVRKYANLIGIENSAKAYSEGKLASEETIKTSKNGSIASMTQEEINAEFGENAAHIVEYGDVIRGKKNYQLAYNIGQAITKMGINVRLYESDRNSKISNGFYKNGTIYLDINAGVSGVRSAIGETFSHELTHWIRANNESGYQSLLDFVKNELGDEFDKQVKMELDKLKKKDNNIAEEEVVANACARMLKNSETFKKYAIADMSGAQRILARLREFVSNMKKAFQGKLGKDGERAADLISDMEGLQKEWEKALNDAIAETTALEAGIDMETYDDSVVRDAIRDTLEEKDKQGKPKGYDSWEDKVSAMLQEKLGIDKATADKYIRDEQSIASMIFDNIGFLDYKPDDRYEAIKKNSDYPQGTVDLTNLCRKRAIFTEIFDSLQEHFPDKLFNAMDIAEIRQVLKDHGYQVACALCFVEDRRQRVGEIAENFIERLKLAKGGALTVVNSKGQTKTLTMTKDLAKQDVSQRAGFKYGDVIKVTDKYIPTQYDLVTYDGFKALSQNHPQVASAFIRANNYLGMSSARLVEGRAEYKRQILDYTPAQVKRINNKGGLRIFSFSDFEAVHLLDICQVITDAAAVGLKIQAYTKVPEFAKLVANTGIKLNRSLIPFGVRGYEVLPDGSRKLKYDTTEGIDINHKDFFDSSDNPNIGNILVGINDEHIRLAMLDDFVDYIIPFHTNQGKNVLAVKGISAWQNYKEYQRERYIDGRKGARDVNIYTQVIDKYNPKNKVEFVNAFLKECKAQKKIPRFDQFLNKVNGEYVYTPGYEKLLLDFKLFDKQGNILPQTTVNPNIDMDTAKNILADEVKNAESRVHVSKQIIKELENKYETRHAARDSEEIYGQDWKPLPQKYQEFLEGTHAIYGDGMIKVYDGDNHSYRHALSYDPARYGRKSYYLRTINPWVASEHREEWQDKRIKDLVGLVDKIRSEGYDSIEMDGYGEIPGPNGERIMHDDVYLFDDSNRIEVPAKTEDGKEKKEEQKKVVTKYTDNEGNKLSVAQRKFFANSKVRDENGNLKVMYHGTDSAGFTVFDRDAVDDGRSFFFTDDLTVAKTYSGTQDTFAPGGATVKGLNEILSEYGFDDAKLRKVGNKYELKDGKTRKTFDSINEAEKHIREYYADDQSDANYAVYLNITNPLIVDAHGSGWDRIAPDEGAIEVMLEYKDGKWTLYKDGVPSDEEFDPWDYGNKVGDDELQEELDAFAERDELENESFYTLLDGTGEYAIEWRTTRTIAEEAERQGYDGVIINNLLDTSIYGSASELATVSTIAIAFEPNQIKSINNTNPTSDDDIRYSLRTLSDGTQYVYLDGDRFLREDGTEMNEKEAYETIVGTKITLPDGDEITFVKNLPHKKRMFKELFHRLPYNEGVNDINALNKEINQNIVEAYQNSSSVLKNDKDRDGKHSIYGIDSFDTRRVIIADDNAAYDLELTIANLNDGRKIAYAKRSAKANDDIWNKIKKEAKVDKSHKSQPSNKTISQSPIDVKRNAQRDSDRTIDEINDDYMNAVSNGNERLMQKYVAEAARLAGYTTPKLFHGTRFFGWTRYKDDSHKTPFIYTSTDSSVSANYAGDNHYAGIRKIGKAFKHSNDINDIIQNAESVYDTKYHIATNKERQTVYDEVVKEASEIADKLNTFDATFDFDDELANAMARIESAFWTVQSFNDEWGNKWNDNRQTKLELLKSDLRSHEEDREKLRNWYGEHRNELSTEQKKFMSYLLSYEVGDALIDMEYSLEKALYDGQIIASDTRGVYSAVSINFAIPSEIQDAMEQIHNIGSYQLYGDLGDNPLEFDANGAQFWALKVPQMGDDEYHGTDKVCEWALENGYTSVIMHNIYDYGNKADNYVFFSPEQIKSADPVTYDDQGNVIPLSERFNSENDDIRYSVRDIANSESEMLVNALKNDSALASDTTSRYSLEQYTKEYNNLRAMEQESFRLAKELKKASPSQRNVLTKKILRLDRQIYKATEKLTEMRTQRVISDILVNEWSKRLADVEWTNELTYQKTKKALEERYGRTIRDLRQKNKNIRVDQKIRDRKKSIENKAKDLMKRLTNPTDKKHIPAVLVEPTAELLNALDFWTPNSEKGDMKFTMKGENLRQKFSNFRSAINNYWKVAQEGEAQIEYMFDQEFFDEIDELESGLPTNSEGGLDAINDMTLEQLEMLDRTLTQLNHLIARGNKMIVQSHYASLEDAQSATAETMLKKKDVRKEAGSVYNRLNAAQADFYAFLRYAGDGTAQIGDALSKAFEQKEWQVKEAVDFTDELLKDHRKEVAKWSKDTHQFTLSSGRTIELSTSQMMEIYLLSNREQARKHILSELGGKGIHIQNKKGRFVKAVKVNEVDIANIVSALPAEAKHIADALQKFVATVSTGWGNMASNLLYGYSKFTEENYWQIRSAEEALPDNATSEAKTQASVTKLQNMGRAKAVKATANNAIYIGDVFDTFSKTIDEMSSYGSVLPAVTDAMRWWNSTIVNEEGERERIKSLIARKMGKDMANVFLDNIRALNGGVLGDSGSNTFLDRVMKFMMGKAKAASVAANMRVVLQQPTAIERALAVIEQKYLAKAMLMKPATKEAQAHSPIAWHKAQGFYSNGLAPSLRQLIVGDATAGEKITEKALWLAGKADDITWGILYNAAMLKVNDTTNLEKGTQKYWDAVNNIFSDIINNTQVVDTPLTKSMAMRSGRLMFFTAFMAEPVKTYNMVMTAVDKIVQDPKNAKNWTRAMYVGLYVFTMTQFINALAQSIADAARDEKDKADYFERYLKYLQKNFIDNMKPWTYIPIIKEIESIRNRYSNNNLALQAAQNTITAMNEINKVVKGTSSKTLYGSAETIAKAFSYATGIPVSSTMRTFRSIANVAGVDLIRRDKYSNAELTANIVNSLDAGDTKSAERYRNELETNLRKSEAYKNQRKELIDKGEKNVDLQLDAWVEKQYTNKVSDYLADESIEINEWALKYLDEATELEDAVQAMSDRYSEDIVVKAIRKSINRETEYDVGDDGSANTIYNSKDINRMLQNGNISEAQKLIDMFEEGYSEMGSSSSPKSPITTYWKPIYQKASLAEKEEIRKMLYKLNWKGKQMYSAKDFEKWK